MRYFGARVISILLVAVMVLCLGATAFAQEGGSFYLAVTSNNLTVVAPEAIPYQPGQTVAEALLASGHTFSGMEDGFVNAIDDVAGSYVRFYDGGGYDLSVPASSIQAIVFSTKTEYSAPLLQLVIRMGQYVDMTNNVQNDPDVQAAYQAALRGLRTADATAAQALLDSLNQAISAYETRLNGQKYSVTFKISQGTAQSITMTDIYGNVTRASGNVVNVVAGEYTFCAASGYNRTEGTVTVSRNISLTVSLPTGQWYGDICLLDSNKNPYPVQQDASAHTAVYQINDTVGSNGVYLNAAMGATPDENTTRLRTIYVGTDGVDRSQVARSWDSTAVNLACLLEPGMEGADFRLEAQYTGADGYTMIQSYQMQISRMPTLANLTVTAGSTALPLEFAPDTLSYALKTSASAVEIAADAFGADGYTVSGTGAVQLPSNGSYSRTVTVSHAGGKSQTYTLQIQKVSAVGVTVQAPAGASLQVRNLAGSEILPTGGKYMLIPGETYTCCTTVGDYHAQGSFVASSGLTVTAAEPRQENALSAFAVYNGSNAATRRVYPCKETFQPATRQYTLTVPDASTTAYLQATAQNGYAVTAEYAMQTTLESTHGQSRTVAIQNPVSDTGATTYLSSCLAKSGYTQTVVLRLSKTQDGVTYWQEYTLRLVRSLHLSSLAVSANGSALLLTDGAGQVISFDRDVTDYYLTTSSDQQTLELSAAFMNQLDATGCCGGYVAKIASRTYSSLDGITLELDAGKAQQDILLEICHADADSVSTIYTLHVTKITPSYVAFSTVPADATVYLTNKVTGKRMLPEGNTFALTPGVEYTYTVTAYGYTGVCQSSYLAPERDATVNVRLEVSPENNTLPDFDAVWPSFRADDHNNGVIDAPMPIQAENAMLSWATKIGEGYSANACGCPILVDGYIYTYAGTTLYKIDTLTGEIAATGTMDHTSSFAINSPTYAEGMIFIGLSDGAVQAFNAQTLESLWIYRDALGGQPNCPITYHNGYIYTGFWQGEMLPANLVCLSVTDEDPTRTDEEKLPTWTHTQAGGFYWAGAYVDDEMVLVGTDDGAAGYTTGYAQLLALEPETGYLLDTIQLPQPGDVRSSIVCDTQTDTCYFTTKGGYFYGIQVKNGVFVDNSLKSIKLYNYADNSVASSTCTPTVYNGRAYVGVSGTSQFGAYSGHNITVLDLENWEIAYTVRTQGYPQTSGVLTTAYDQGDGTVYVYFFDNYTPGKLRMLQDRPGQTQPSLVTVESYTSSGKTQTWQTAYNLFTPAAEQAQYAICSPIVDEYGNIYFKNDSAYLMALTSTVERLEITRQPQRLDYAVGDVFDPTGMQVTAVYANGTTRDVTAAVTWSTEALTADDTEFIITFPHAMYQNVDGAAGVTCSKPMAVLTLQISLDGHVHSYTATVVEPTCTEPGYTNHVCACGDSYQDSFVAALGHTWDEGVVTTRPTQYNPGEITYTCTRCGQTQTEPIPATGVCDGGDSCPGHSFTDMPPVTNWAHKGIDFAVEYGLFAGMTETTFAPNGTMTRAMLVSVLYRLEGKPSVEGLTTGFTDVPDGQWYTAAIIWANQNRIVAGVSETQFAPNGQITREQMAAILYRYANFKGYDTQQRADLTGFPDYASVSEYAQSALSWANAAGLISGTTNNGITTLDPRGSATRAQVASILMRYIQKVVGA